MSFKNIRPRRQNNNKSQGVITVFYTPEFFALTLPFLNDEIDIESKISPSAILALSDSKAPEGLRNEGEKEIIEHILVARNVAYNVVSIRHIADEEGSVAYSVTITLPQQGSVPLTIGDTILLLRKCASGFDAVTLVSKNSPHHYHHLPYGIRPATRDDLLKLSRKLHNRRA